MKHWDELTEIETAIIRLDVLQSLVRVIASGVPQTNLDDAANSLWHIQGALEDIGADLRLAFDNLWDVIDNEPQVATGGMSKKKNMTNKELP